MGVEGSEGGIMMNVDQVLNQVRFEQLGKDMKKAKRDIKILQFTNFVMLVAFLVWFMMEGVNL